MARNKSSRFGVEDDLDFSSEQAGQELPIKSLIAYSNHPFALYTGERLSDMVESIRKNGVLIPIIVRSTDKEGIYEILAGHNRVNAAKLAGLTAVPAIIKENLSDADAEMYVIETNAMQRGFNDLKVTEQAAILGLRHSKMFDPKKEQEISEELTALAAQDGKEGKISKLEAAGKEYGLGKTSVSRYVKINDLLTMFKDTAYSDKLSAGLNSGELSIRAAVELAFIPKAALEAIFDNHIDNVDLDNLWTEGIVISHNSAVEYRAKFKDFKGKKSDAKKMLASPANEEKQDKPKSSSSFRIKKDIFEQFFNEDDTNDFINGVIQEALQRYFEDKPDLRKTQKSM